MPVSTRTQWICDRCGWDSEKAEKAKFADFGETNLSWNGHTGGYSCMGDSGGSTHKGTAWLCLECTRAFLRFIANKEEPRHAD